MGEPTQYVWGSLPNMYGGAYPLCMGEPTQYVWGSLPNMYGGAYPLCMGEPTQYVWGSLPNMYAGAYPICMGEPTQYVWGSHPYPSAATRSDPSGSTWRCRRRCRQRVPTSLISRHSSCACTCTCRTRQRIEYMVPRIEAGSCYQIRALA